MKWVQISRVKFTLINTGCYEISLGDTIGVGTPEKTHKLFQAIKNIPKENLAAHFHDTYDKAIENLLAALEVIFDFPVPKMRNTILCLSFHFPYF